MWRQLSIIVAVVFATVTIVATGYASTRMASEHKHQLAHHAPLQNLTLTTTTTTTTTTPTIAVVDDGTPTTGPQDGTTPDPVPANLQDPADGTPADAPACDVDQLNAEDLSNHGSLVSACVAQLKADGDFEGPLGQIVRDIARPDIENDGPPRSDQGEEHSSNDKESKDKATPPGQNKEKPAKNKDH